MGSTAQWDRMRLVSGSYKLELAQYLELQSFSQFAADIGVETTNRLTRGLRLVVVGVVVGLRLVEILKQFSGSPINLSSQVGILSLANQNLMKGLAIQDVQLLLKKYLSVPVWALLFIDLL